MKNRWKSFIFENWEWNAEEQKLSLRYSFDGEVPFEENWWFDFEINPDVPFEIVEKAFEGLWIAAGVSYFKAGIPCKIEFRKGIQAMDYKLSSFAKATADRQTTNKKLKTANISKSQAEFFEKVWMNGLGEFFFHNKIDPKGVVRFPVNETANFKFQTLNLK